MNLYCLICNFFSVLLDENAFWHLEKWHSSAKMDMQYLGVDATRPPMINSFFRSKKVTHVWLDDHLVILDTESGKYFSLNSSAAEFFLNLPVEPNDYCDQWNDEDNFNEFLNRILQPVQAGARVMILEMLTCNLLRVNPVAERGVEDYFEEHRVPPALTHWGTVATNTLVAGS